KDLTNKTVTEWIIESLILKAKALLKSTEMNIQELSDYFNFSDASAFGKFFKKNVKMTPNEYRKNED
ncbi:MAG: helix-turn-helix domain-containing protein, partial [Bacteroidaceae bacterium]|nr:helix-turn-helix domain-containing protein [Bacteroidaceae bacterium]